MKFKAIKFKYITTDRDRKTAEATMYFGTKIRITFIYCICFTIFESLFSSCSSDGNSKSDFLNKNSNTASKYFLKDVSFQVGKSQT